MKRSKLQVTLPEELIQIVKSEAKKDFRNVSQWVEKVIVKYLENDKNEEVRKKVIDLGI